MLYTRKGDAGTTKILNSENRFSKNSAVAEALGAVDELNSLLGLCRAQADKINFQFSCLAGRRAILNIQENLFIIQAELAGSDKSISVEKIKETENIIDSIEKSLPPIKSFFIPGATEFGAMLDLARTVARRAERRVVAFKDTGGKISAASLAYLNRLSSLLYALARLVNSKSGAEEKSPTYK